MDPIAHTLVGAALAEAGLKRWTRYATPALIVGANLPDIDGIANIWGRDASLYFRRGWSHGVLALVLLPLVLAGALWLWHQWRAHRCRPGAGEQNLPLRLGLLVGLCYLAVWSHPFLDWLNTYGVRLLMPFSDRWFYGDTLFIVDPWFWLLTAAGVVLGRSRGPRAVAGWALLGALASVLILWTDQLPTPAKLVWLVGIGALVLLRLRKPPEVFCRTAAQAGLATLVLYIGALYGFARMAESLAAGQHGQPLEAQANPLPGTPLAHRVILVYDSHYRVQKADGDYVDVAREQPGPIVQRALQHESVRGFVTWMRFPYWEVTETEQSWIVELRDLRYVGPDQSNVGIGTATVELPKSTLDDHHAR